jgi:hypothetical protein
VPARRHAHCVTPIITCCGRLRPAVLVLRFTLFGPHVVGRLLHQKETFAPKVKLFPENLGTQQTHYSLLGDCFRELFLTYFKYGSTLTPYFINTNYQDILNRVLLVSLVQ